MMAKTSLPSRRLLLGAVLGLWLVYATPSVSAPSPSALADGAAAAPDDNAVAATQVVESFQSALIRAAAEAQCAARVAPLSAAVAELFDIPGIARQVLRRQWGTLDPSARRRFAAALQELTVLGFATRFTARAAVFSPAEVQRRQGDRILVNSALQRPDDAPVRFSYLLAARNDGWAIQNVVVAGVSELSLRSAQYGDLVEREGFDALMGRMNEEIKETRALCE